MCGGKGFLNTKVICHSEEVSTAHARMNASKRELLKDVLDEHDLYSKPAQIYNVDKTGVLFDYKVLNVVSKTGVQENLI